MDIRTYVYQLIDIFPSPLRTPARWVADRVFSVWNDVSMVFRITVPFWARWYDSAVAFASSFIVAGNEIALTIRWVVAQWAPSFILNKVNAARDWLLARLGEARDFLQDRINGVLQWASDRINGALDFITRVRDWAWEYLKSILATLAVVARIVGDLLTDPRKLAAWVAGEMFWALLRVADALIEPIVEYVWARRQGIILRVLSRIEAIIARVL